ncbi:MAG: hypothetical protein KatS3mg052_1214 [Candidatus Roseilinea sp.]|nr:MAG: hypothetical protein KatS3mg052_1214 [Candidatus Roseilinea sp.]
MVWIGDGRRRRRRIERMIGRIQQRLAGMRRVKRVAGPERAMGLSFVQPASIPPRAYQGAFCFKLA